MAQPEGGSYICPASAPPVTVFWRLAAGYASGVGGLKADCPEMEFFYKVARADSKYVRVVGFRARFLSSDL